MKPMEPINWTKSTEITTEDMQRSAIGKKKDSGKKNTKGSDDLTILWWAKDGVNYWENPDCPKAYLEGALVRLIEDVEGTNLPIDHFADYSKEYVAERVGFYEYLLDK